MSIEIAYAKGYNMSTFITANQVEVTFDSNYVEFRDGDYPFLSFDEKGNLTSIHIVGYHITPIGTETITPVRGIERE